MELYPTSVSIDGAFIGVGGNTPFPEFRGKYIEKIKVTECHENPSAVIEVVFQDSTVLRVRTSEYKAIFRDVKGGAANDR